MCPAVPTITDFTKISVSRRELEYLLPRMFPTRRQLSVAAAVCFIATLASGLPGDDKDNQFSAEYKHANELLAAGKLGDARKSFEKADKLHGGTCGDCRYQMAELDLKFAKYDDCMRDVDKALPNLADAKAQALAHNLKGVVLMGLADGKVDRLEKAKAEFTTAKQLNGSDPM